MNITVDFHQFTSELGTEQNPESALIDWVKGSPRASRIHVVLRPPRFDAAARKLQHSLQSLGCTVTRCTTFTVVPA